MKIERNSLKGKTLGSSKSSRTDKKEDFLEALAASQEAVEIEPVLAGEDADQNMKNMAALIDQYGETLVDNPTPENFLRYKNHIKTFINLLKDNYEIKNITSRKGFTSQKLYLTINSVDENLNQLAQMVMSREQNRIRYLKMVDSIKGMIIDLTL